MDNSTMPTPRIPDDPLMTIEISEPAAGLLGWVCLHSMGREGSAGGIRCVGDVTIEEVRLLARAMTYKYAFFGLPQGGAKAGIRIGYDGDPARKAEIIRAAARHLQPLVLRSTIWSPWTDMNFSGEDLRLFMAELGRSYVPNPRHNSSHRTAIAWFWSLQGCLDFYGLDPRTTRLTIEGFGSVASHLAPYLLQMGIKVVAVSNHLGTVANPAGLDLAAILQASERHGYAWIDQHGPWQRLPREALFRIETEVMVPGNRVHSIGEEYARHLPARLVLPIANVPCTEDALRVFDQRGIDYLPDFVVNGGGVSGHIQRIDDPYGDLYKAMLRRLLTQARAERCPPRQLAAEAAHANYGRIMAEAYQTDSLPLRIVQGMAHRGLLPKTLLHKARRDHLDRLYDNMEGLFSSCA